MSVAVARYGDKAWKLAPRLASIASWVGYDLDGRTDIKWTFSFLIRLREKQRSAQRHPRPLSCPQERRWQRRGGAAAVAAAHRQARPRDRGRRRADRRARPDRPRRLHAVGGRQRITRGDGYNLVSAEPLIALFDQLIAAAPDRKIKARYRRHLGPVASQRGSGTVAHPPARQRGADQQRLPRLRARAVDARPRPSARRSRASSR